MIKIAHRGNINGKILERENSPDYILEAISKGYDVEIDVWLIKDELYLGHDNPKYIINPSFIENKRLWCHAKNIQALNYCLKNKKKIHSFWHQNDDYTITSNGFLWTYPGKLLVPSSIAVLPELIPNYNTKNVLGICSDFIVKY